mmetsp:Transcript_25824/g.45546  ORF Transcript_25824/g.45546 Transcript_25824/m.45546 type:complete len:704 (+) Transcript_25824:3286-5397(+)
MGGDYKSIELTLMKLNVIMPTLRGLVCLLGPIFGNAVNLEYFCLNTTLALISAFLIRLYSEGKVLASFARFVAVDLSCLAFIYFGFVDEPHLNLIWVMGYTYTVLLIQAPNVKSPSYLKLFSYFKPLLIISAAGLACGQVEIRKYKDVFAIISIVAFGYLASIVHNNEISKVDKLLSDLKEAKDQLKNIISAVPAGIIVVSCNGEIVRANEQAYIKLNCNSKSELNAMVKTLELKQKTQVPEKTNEKLIDKMMDYLSKPIEELIVFGQVEISDSTLSIIGNKTVWKKMPAIVIVLKDVTDVLQLERTKNESYFKNVMLRSVSHELKTPTNGILHSVQAVASGNDVPDWAKSKLCIAEVSCKHLLMLISDLLDFSQLIAGKFSLQKSLFNLRRLIKESVELMTLVAIKKQISIMTHIDPLLPDVVFTDANRLSQVLLNFLSNAVKFTPKHGKIEVMAVLSDNCQMELKVKDNGIGIDTAQISKLFEAFSRLESSSAINPQGVGLGLNISNMLAWQLGNAPIAVESRLAVGSCFKCLVTIFEHTHSTLFCYDIEDSSYVIDETDATANKVYSFSVRETVLPRILVVDDSPFNRTVISDILNSESLDCAECDTGVEAIDYILKRARYCPVDLVIMDFEMPIMNGPTTCRLLLDKLMDLKLPIPAIIAHSAYSSEEDKNLCKEAGMVDFLPKPSSKQEILAKLKLYL